MNLLVLSDIIALHFAFFAVYVETMFVFEYSPFIRGFGSLTYQNLACCLFITPHRANFDAFHEVGVIEVHIITDIDQKGGKIFIQGEGKPNSKDFKCF